MAEVWSISNGGSIDAGTGVMALNSAGTYSVTYTLGTTCPVDNTVQIVVEEPLDPTISDPGTIVLMTMQLPCQL